jgi:hypothetical protein
VPCLFAVFTLIVPRVFIVFLWLFTGWFRGVFSMALWPVLGFFFLPTTVLWYSVVQNWFGGVWTLWPIVGIVASLMIDVSPMKRRRWRHRVRED